MFQGRYALVFALLGAVVGLGSGEKARASEDVEQCLAPEQGRALAGFLTPGISGHQRGRLGGHPPHHESEACVPDRSCEGMSFGRDRSCLAARVPWRIPHARVKCCFRCCLFYWQRELGLDAVRGDWEWDLKEHGVPSAAGTKKHGWPAWDDVIFSHMTPFVWASSRRLSGAFLGGTRLEKSALAFQAETAASARPGGFAALEGGYPARADDLDPSGAAPPAVVVVGTDEWLGPAPERARGPVREYYVSNPRELAAEATPGACLGAPVRPPKGQHMSKLPEAVAEWAQMHHPNCTSPERYYAAVPESVARRAPVHAFPRALQRTTGWAALLDGREARGAMARPNLLMCGGSIKLRGGRAEVLAVLKKQGGFPCAGKAHTQLDEYVAALLGSKFAWSPTGHGWTNHREFEILLAGSVPVVEFHPNLLELYRGLPVLQVKDWASLTPQVLEVEWEKIESRDRAGEYNLNKLYWPYWLHRFTMHLGPPPGGGRAGGKGGDGSGGPAAKAPRVKVREEGEGPSAPPAKRPPPNQVGQKRQQKITAPLSPQLARVPAATAADSEAAPTQDQGKALGPPDALAGALAAGAPNLQVFSLDTIGDEVLS